MKPRRAYYWYCKRCHHAMPYDTRGENVIDARHKYSNDCQPKHFGTVILIRITFNQAMKWDKEFRKHGGFRSPR